MTQDERIRRLAEQGWLPVGIAQILGMNEQVVRRKLSQMTYDSGKALRPTSEGLPYGVTDASFKLRATLGAILVDLSEKYQQAAVSSLTGLNRREIRNAIEAPYKHDWKLSQIERTLDCDGKTIVDITS